MVLGAVKPNLTPQPIAVQQDLLAPRPVPAQRCRRVFVLKVAEPEPFEQQRFGIEIRNEAVEAVHRSHADAYRYELMEHARQAGLGITVGSDFHGDGYGHAPGRMPVNLKALVPAFRP